MALEKQYLLAVEQHADTDAMVHLGHIYRDQHKWVLAEKYFLMALPVKRNDSNTLVNLGYVFRMRNMLNLAEEYFLMAAKLHNTIAMGHLGGIYKEKNEFDLAEKYFLMAIENARDDPNHVNRIAMNNNLGSLYEEHYKFNLAIKYYLKALLYDGKIIERIVNIIPKLSYELQLELLEVIPQIRTNDMYFKKLHHTVCFKFMDKKMGMLRHLSNYLIGNLVDICLDYY
jgi:tetratricopeptide (TPR) repeat protein